MKTTASQKIKIGVFTLAGILLLVAGIFIIGKKKNLFGSTFHIYGTFNNVGGLQEGNNIRFSGINVGTVETISIISDSLIRVDMVLQSKIKPFLKINSFAAIGSDGLMGDKLITINAGTANKVLLPNGGKIITINPLDFDKSLATLTKVAANAEILSRSLAGISIQVSQGKGSLGRLLYKDDLAVSLEGTMNNARTLSGSLASITNDLRSGKGSVGRLLYTDTLAKSLEGTAANAKIAMSTINDAAFGFSENMKALQGNFLFKGYFKRQAKEKARAASLVTPATDTTDVEMTESELNEIEAAAQKAQQAIIDRKKKAKENQ
jgi:phospholipid/cholesterol/gamma-HCH transport system substrate-binding protein